MCIQSLKTQAPLEASFEFFVTQYNLSYPMSVPNFKILSQVVSEKSLTEKKVYKQTNIVTEKAKTIYPLYTSYAGGIIRNCIIYTKYRT